MSAEIGSNVASAEADGLEIAYEAPGSGETALLLIHGAFEDRSYYRDQVAHFSQFRRVVALDLRGHGDSSVSCEVTLDDFAADVIAVADAAGLENAVLCGHSMAGVVALKVAALRPDLVRGVVMLDGTILFPEPVLQAGRSNLVPALGTDGWLDALRGYLNARILDPQDAPALQERVMAGVARTHAAFARSLFASLFVSDHAAALAGTQCPLLYVHGKVPADLQRLKQLRPDATVERVVGCGHYLMLTAPDRVNAMIDTFLVSIASASLAG